MGVLRYYEIFRQRHQNWGARGTNAELNGSHAEMRVHGSPFGRGASAELG